MKKSKSVFALSVAGATLASAIGIASPAGAFNFTPLLRNPDTVTSRNFRSHPDLVLTSFRIKIIIIKNYICLHFSLIYKAIFRIKKLAYYSVFTI